MSTAEVRTSYANQTWAVKIRPIFQLDKIGAVLFVNAKHSICDRVSWIKIGVLLRFYPKSVRILTLFFLEKMTHLRSGSWNRKSGNSSKDSKPVGWIFRETVWKVKGHFSLARPGQVTIKHRKIHDSTEKSRNPRMTVGYYWLDHSSVKKLRRGEVVSIFKVINIRIIMVRVQKVFVFSALKGKPKVDTSFVKLLGNRKIKLFFFDERLIENAKQLKLCKF